MLHTHYGVNKLSPMRSFLQGAPLKWSWRRGAYPRHKSGSNTCYVHGHLHWKVQNRCMSTHGSAACAANGLFFACVQNRRRHFLS